LDGLTVRTVRRRIQQHHLPSVAAEMVYNGLLALVAGSLFGATAIAWLSIQPAPWSLLAPDAVTQFWQQWKLLPTVTADSLGQALMLMGLGFGFGLWGAMGGIRALMRALDTIHGNRPRTFWATQRASLGLIACGLIGGQLLITLLSNHHQFTTRLQGQTATLWVLATLTLWQLLGGAIALMLITLIFAGLYRWVPHRWRPGIPCLPGAALVALSWGGVSLGLWTGYQQFALTAQYGGLVGGLCLLLWLYLGALLLLVGAQLNATVGKRLQRLMLNPYGNAPQVAPPPFASFTIQRRDRYH
jgi:membrane protein